MCNCMRSNQRLNNETDEATRIHADRQIIIDAVIGKMKETDGKRHIIELRDEDFEDSDDKTASWKVVDRLEFYDEYTYGENYIEVEDIAMFDCNDDAYTPEWENRIEIRNKACASGEKFIINTISNY